jgi:3-methyladenine DNA glycosylase AlkD
MDKTEVLRKLRALGTAQNRAIYARHGVTGEPFGVSFASLDRLRREIGTDHDLAEQLWASGNHDARILAAMIADPARMTAGACAAWLEGVGDHVVAAILAGLVARSAAAKRCFRKWSASSDEWREATAWNLLAALVHGEPRAFGDAECERALRAIEQRIASAASRARQAMNAALIAIAARSPALRRKALAAARRIGKAAAGRGATGAETADASACIERLAHRRRARAKRKAAKTARKARR